MADKFVTFQIDEEVKEKAELTNKALKHSFNYFMSHYRKK